MVGGSLSALQVIGIASALLYGGKRLYGIFQVGQRQEVRFTLHARYVGRTCIGRGGRNARKTCHAILHLQGAHSASRDTLAGFTHRQQYIVGDGRCILCHTGEGVGATCGSYDHRSTSGYHSCCIRAQVEIALAAHHRISGSHEKTCGLCVDFCQSEQEKLSIYDATQQSPELFHFCIKGFSRCICRPIDKVVKDFILSVIHSCRYIIEGFIPKFSYFAIP